MSEPTGPVCPQCGTPRAADGTPACSCAEQASEAHRDSRTAQAAAAEDFDPVRIRPFVKVGDGTTEHDGPATGTDLAEGSAYASDAPTRELPPCAEDSPRPGAPDERPPADAGHHDGRRRRRKRLAAGGGAAAVAAVVAAGLAGGLFSYDAPSRDGSPADDVRARLPEAASRQDTASTPAPSGTASPTRPSGTPTVSPDETSTESPATPTGSAGPTRTPSDSGATRTSAPPPTGGAEQNPVLGFGDRGPEVTELQLRLRQVGLYNGDIDGDYDREVENAVRGYQLTRVVLDDESGVYGRPTRSSLESETSEPDLGALTSEP